MSSRVLSAFVALLVVAAAGCATYATPMEVAGSCGNVFKSQVCTWATLDGSTLVEAGAMVPIASIENAPAEVPMVWPPVPEATIDMPDLVRQQGGLVQFTVDWEAGGHPPAAFMTPHFDFHFYTMGAADVAAIDCKDESKPAALPAAYALPDIPLPPHMAHMMGVPALVGLCVPKMGMHGVPAADVARTEVFGGTMVVGYYKGKPIFIEPMVSKAMLMKKAAFELPIPEVPGLAGPHPTKFRAEYDTTQQAYRLILSGFVAGS